MTPQQAFSEALHRAGSQAALASIVGKRQLGHFQALERLLPRRG
ncbi:hypothetical protein QP185_04460 [Sphingomonas aerolata]